MQKALSVQAFGRAFAPLRRPTPVNKLRNSQTYSYFEEKFDASRVALAMLPAFTIVEPAHAATSDTGHVFSVAVITSACAIAYLYYIMARNEAQTEEEQLISKAWSTHRHVVKSGTVLYFSTIANFQDTLTHIVVNF